VSEPAGPGEQPHWVAVGRIGRAHGVRGEVAVQPLSQVPERFEKGSRLFLDESEARPVTVCSSRPHRHRLLVSFEESVDRASAERLTGRYLFAPPASAPNLPDGEFWAHQVVGCRVMTEAGRELGTITDVIHTPANDVWTARHPAGEILIPALKDIVAEVRIEERSVIVREIPGLTAP
jgi:16S rRNA processing protein RimM